MKCRLLFFTCSVVILYALPTAETRAQEACWPVVLNPALPACRQSDPGTKIYPFLPSHFTGSRFYNRAYKLVSKGKYKQALSVLNKFIALNSNFSSAFVLRAKSYRKMGFLERSHSDATRAIQINPNLTRAYSVRGEVNLSRRRPLDAIDDFSEAIKRDPLSHRDYFGRATGRKRRNHFELALNDIEKALKISPGNHTYKDLRKAVRAELEYIATTVGSGVESCWPLVVNSSLPPCTLKHYAKQRIQNAKNKGANISEGVENFLLGTLSEELWSEMEKSLKSALVTAEKKYGEVHSVPLTIQKRILNLYLRMRRYDEAILLQKRVDRLQRQLRR